MLSIQGDTVNEVWFEALKAVMRNGSIAPTRIGASIELAPVILKVGQPRDRVLRVRTYNIAFGYAEFLWIVRGEKSLQFVQFWNPRMKNYSDDGNSLNGAYGHRLRHAFGMDQLHAAYQELRVRPESRQVVLQIWKPELDFPIAGPASKDVACSLCDHLLVRNGKLEWLHVMRSNDLIWGTPYDILVFTLMQEIVSGWLGLHVGSYTHLACSLQVYEQHWEYARKVIKQTVSTRSAETDDLRLTYDEFHIVLNKMLDTLTLMIDTNEPKEIISLWTKCSVPTAYGNILTVMVAELLCRKGAIQEGFRTAQECSNRSQRLAISQWLRNRYNVNE